MDISRRDYVANVLRMEFEQTLEGRIDRYLSINHQTVIPDHHFSSASAECINLFRDRYFIACICLTQSVAEGIIKFIRERNGVAQIDKESKEALAARMKDAGILSTQFVDALGRIRRSFRDDFHHMNPKVAEVELEPLASRNIADLAAMEREIFAVSFSANGRVQPRQLQYWDADPNGYVPAYVRLV